MKNILFRITTIVVLSLSVQAVVGQVATSLYFMDNLPQSNALNPAFDPNYNFYLGIPLINNTNVSFTSDIGLGNVYQNDEFFWNSEEALNNFVGGLSETSFLSTEINSSLFTLGFATGESGYFHFGVTNRMDMVVGVPKDLFRMNDLTINHDLSGLEMQVRDFNEYAFGYSYEVDEKLIVGAKVKLLAGIACATVSFDQFDVQTGDDEWGVNLDGAVDIAGPMKVETNEKGFPIGIEETIDFGNASELIDYGSQSFKNAGFAIDLGVEYQVLDKLKLSASIIDLGKINWNNSLQNLQFDDEYMFGGLTDIITTDGDGILSFDDDVVSNITDSLENVFSSEESANSFSNTLSPKLFLGAEYELTHSLSVGMLYKARFIRKEVRHNMYFNANANFKNMLTLGANYNHGFNSQSSYGGVIGLRLSPFYIYVAADVLPGFGKTTFKDSTSGDFELPFGLPADLSAANLQFGINFVLGNKQQKREKSMKNTLPTYYKENLENSSVNYPL